MVEPGLTFAERYRLEHELARGGMGSVWVAWDERLSRKVAIKFMSQELQGADGEQRFHREAAAAAQLRTKHVVEIFDHGVADHTPFIVMELLEGESLSSLLRRRTRLSLTECASLLGQIAKGLRAAHKAHIVHRDLKPQNIFMARDADGDETVKILDFGVAKHRSPAAPGESTATGVLLGSPHYMSPEQSRAVRDIDERSDLWSVGVILYRALTGRKPWQSESVVDLLVIICTEPFTPPSQLVPELPPAIDAFFTKALAPDPEDRFANVDELTEAFREAAGMHVADGTGQHLALSSAPELRAPLPSLSSLPDSSNVDDGATTIRRESAPLFEPADAGTLRGATAASGSAGTARSASWLLVALVAAGMAGIALVAWITTSEPSSASETVGDHTTSAAPASTDGPGEEPDPPHDANADGTTADSATSPTAEPDATTPSPTSEPSAAAEASASGSAAAPTPLPTRPRPAARPPTPKPPTPKPGDSDVPWF